MVDRISWEVVLKGRGIQKGWRRRAKRKLTTWASGEDFGLFKDLRGRVLWKEALYRQGAQASLLVFTGHLQAQVWFIPLNRKSDENTWGPAWMSRELLAKINTKKYTEGRNGNR